MRRVTTAVLGLGLAAAMVATAGVTQAAPGGANDTSQARPAGPVGIELEVLGSYATGIFNESAAEIVAHDPATQRLFVVNAHAGLVEVLDVADPAEPAKLFDLVTAGVAAADGSAVPPIAIANSVAVHGDTVAVAVEATPKTDDGWVVFFDAPRT